jgi:hypothetical protein
MSKMTPGKAAFVGFMRAGKMRDPTDNWGPAWEAMAPAHKEQWEAAAAAARAFVEPQE